MLLDHGSEPLDRRLLPADLDGVQGFGAGLLGGEGRLQAVLEQPCRFGLLRVLVVLQEPLQVLPRLLRVRPAQVEVGEVQVHGGQLGFRGQRRLVGAEGQLPVAFGLLLLALMIVTSNLLADLVYSYLDPRVVYK